MKLMKDSDDELESQQDCPSNQLFQSAGSFFLLIEGERVGPFVQTGGNDRLVQNLRDRGLVIEMDKLRSR